VRVGRRGAERPSHERLSHEAMVFPAPVREARSAGRLDLAVGHNGCLADAAVVPTCMMCLYRSHLRFRLSFAR
jgi:hypothetical protein